MCRITWRSAVEIAPVLARRASQAAAVPLRPRGQAGPAGRRRTLRPDYQALLASGNLKPSEATELVRLSPRGQDTLFNAIRTGGCRSYNDLRASSSALVNAEAQLLLMPDAPPPPTKEDRELANAFEAHVERVAALLRSGIHENQIVAVRKTSPHRAGTLADLLAVMQTDLRRIEVALREVAIQASFLAAA